MTPRAPTFLRWAVGSAFSVGPGYEPQPPGTRFSPHGIEGYYLDYSAKTGRQGDPASLVPAGRAQLALGWWERHLTGERDAGRLFLDACRSLECAGERDEMGIWWPYSVAVPKYGLRPPWVSAMAQGQIASVFVRAFVLTGDEHYRTLAGDAVRTLLPPSRLVRSTAAGPVLEEAPSDPPSHVLNGWIFALWGIRDVLTLGETAAGGLYRDTLTALRKMLPRYDVGWWSRYSLFPHALTDLAKPFYHRLHSHQLKVLGLAEGIPEFVETAELWESYDVPRRRVAAVAHKVVFAAVDGRQRRTR